MSYLKDLDYSVIQQCMHCGMCLPTCPTYDATKIERNSPRGRIALMRAIADGQIEAKKAFADEMYFCLGCLACETACPAGVDYTQLFEMVRAEAERSPAEQTPLRKFTRWLLLGVLFHRQSRLRLAGRLLYLYRVTGLQALMRATLVKLLPKSVRDLESKTPVVQRHFSPDLIPEVAAAVPSGGRVDDRISKSGCECGPIPPLGQGRLPSETGVAQKSYRVALLTGCVQDLIYSDVNRDTADVLLANQCTVVTPRAQGCCGSLHAHNGEYEMAKGYARRLIDQFDLDALDAIITNAAGCGSHLKHFDRLLKDDPTYAARAAQWSAKVKDISEWLVEIDFRAPEVAAAVPGGGIGVDSKIKVTYHDACHLCHGQKITAQPRDVLAKIPGLVLTPLTESMWCCGSAGIYNLIQPAMAEKLLQRKIEHIAETGAQIVATGNPGCLLQIQNGLRARGIEVACAHPVTLLAQAYRAENAAR